MDGQEEVLVAGCSDHVGCEEEAPGEHGGVAEEVRAADLEGDDAEHDIFG